MDDLRLEGDDGGGARRGADPGSNRGGGPATAAGRERALGNLSPETASITHGGNRWMSRGLAPACDQCIIGGLSVAHRRREPECEAYEPGQHCRLAIAARDELYTQIMALPHISEAQHTLVREFRKHAVVVEITDLWLGETGVFALTEMGWDVKPLVTARDRWSTRMQSLADALGLTPAAQARLKLTETETGMAKQFAMAFAQLEADRDDKRAGAVEGEFEVEDGGGGTAMDGGG